MKDPKYIAEQLSQLRDLLIVIERGGDKTPDVLYKLAIEKSQNITLLVEEWRQESNPPGVAVPPEYDLWIEGKTNEETQEPMPSATQELPTEPQAIEEPVSIPVDFDVVSNHADIEPADTAEEDNPQEDDEEDYVAPFVEDSDPIQPTPEAVVPQEPVDIEADMMLEPLVENIEKPTEDASVEENAETETDLSGEDAIFMDEVAEMEEATFEDAEYGFVEDDDEDDDEDNDEENDEEDDDDLEEQDLYNRGEPFETEPVATIGDMMSAHRGKELRKSLSLNDRYRFRRELFGNIDVEMNNTLALIDTMSDLAEAREYLLQDRGWSAEDTVVQEFLALVERHFKS